MDAVINYYLNYRSVNGRTSRKDFWLVQVAHFIFIFLLYIFANMSDSVLLVLFLLLFTIFNFIPNTTLIIRRLHDINYSGMYLLVLLIPILNLVLSLYIAFTPGSPSVNDYGPVPKNSKNTVNRFGPKPKESSDGITQSFHNTVDELSVFNSRENDQSNIHSDYLNKGKVKKIRSARDEQTDDDFDNVDY